jgi:thiol-disulfide isomerase/thioredoxin
MRVETQSEMVIDRSPHGELLRINFNISFPELSCEYATLDVSDALGLKRLNLTKTVRKVPIDSNLAKAGGTAADLKHNPKYDEEHPGEHFGDADFALPLTSENANQVMTEYDIVVVNFYAPWCPWCQKLAPTWEAATEEIHIKYPLEDGRIRYAKVDCTDQVELCRKHVISAFPSIRIFRGGSDDVVSKGHHEHEAYYGDRTKDALVKLADDLAPTAGLPHNTARVANVASATRSQGCNFSGFVLVKKVPGTLHFVARAPGHSFDYLKMNLSHRVHAMYFGNRPSPRRARALSAYHPAGLTTDWSDKLMGQSFLSTARGATFEHYMQVVLTSIQPKSKPEAHFDAYEYTVQSHVYDTTPKDPQPNAYEDEEEVEENRASPVSAKFTYRMSPIQILVTERSKPMYTFLTSFCAVIGGVFTVAGILDGTVHTVGLKIKKKIDLGKQT